MDIVNQRKIPIKHKLLNLVGKRVAISYRKRYDKDPEQKEVRMPFGNVMVNCYPDGEFRIHAEIILNRFVKSNYRKFYGKRRRIKKRVTGNP